MDEIIAELGALQGYKLSATHPEILIQRDDAIAIVRASWPVVDDAMVEETYSLFYRSIHTDRMRQRDAFKKALQAALDSVGGDQEAPRGELKAVIAEIERLGAMTSDQLASQNEIGFFELLDMALTLKASISRKSSHE